MPWINVTDRMPTKSGFYQVRCTKDAGNGVHKRLRDGVVYYDSIRKGFAERGFAGTNLADMPTLGGKACRVTVVTWMEGRR